jgi:6-pyruvoyltetrahydropterin/6-carboxytetrahydropterin synthase
LISQSRGLGDVYKRQVSRRATFNAAHRLFRPDWTNEKNVEIFGKCSNPNYHGHNYVLEVILDGEIDQETGYVIDLKIVKDAIKSEIDERFDHRNLNLDCPEFKDLNPTAENIAVVVWNLLRNKLPQHLALTIKLWETENNCVEYAGK